MVTARKVIPIKKITSWSFSRYNDYKQCPLKAKLKFIDKISEPPNDAMARGDKIHKSAEAYIKGTLAKLPADLKSFDKMLKDLKAQYKKRALGMTVEETWAFRNDWSTTTWNDWNGCVLRIKVDCAYHTGPESMIVVDWKTGKFRPEKNEEYVEQQELYALGAMMAQEHVEEVQTKLVYTDAGLIFPSEAKDVEELTFDRGDISRLVKLWATRTKPMLNDTKFAPRPNNNCRWCWYGQSKVAEGGPGLCKY